MYYLNFLKVGIATPPIKVGNLKYNADEIIKILDHSQASVVLFPELNLTSLYCGDLFLNDEFLEKVLETAERIIKTTKFTGLFTIGLPLKIDQYVVNGLLVVYDNEVIGCEMKNNLNLEERRYFSSFLHFDMEAEVLGVKIRPFPIVYKSGELNFGITLDGVQGISELNSDYLVGLGANIILNASSDYEVLNSGETKVRSVLEASKRQKSAYIYASPAKSESTSKYVYAGDMIAAIDGELLDEATNLYDNLNYLEVDVDVNKLLIISRKEELHDDFIAEEAFQTFDFKESKTYQFETLSPYPFLEGNDPFDAASVINTLLVEALIKKISSLPKHLQKVIIGVSGGADSTLALLIAEQALEKMGLPSTNLIGVSMPSENSLEISSKRALELIKGVKATKLLIPIDNYLKVHLEAINHENEDVTYENAQARIRTNILMDLANKYGGIVLGPSDLSEIALGFTTYNGDASSMYGINQGILKL